jgi:hypothetical protein
MIDDDARRDRMPLPPVTSGAIRAAPAGTPEAATGQAPLLPPFMAGRTTTRWKLPFPPQRPHAQPPTATGPDTPGPVPVVEPPPAVQPPAPVAETPAPQATGADAAAALPAFDDRMPWEIDDVAEAAADFFVPGPFVTPPEDRSEPTQDTQGTQDTQEPWAPWDPSQLWDAGPSQPLDLQEPSSQPRSEVSIGDDQWQQDVTERVAARLEELAQEVRARGIAALGAAENADELSRLLAGVIAGFLARDEHA